MQETYYQTAARLTRACKTLDDLKRREKQNMNCYNNGALTVREYYRISQLEMSIYASLS